MRSRNDRSYPAAFYSFIGFISTLVILSVTITLMEYSGLVPANNWTRPFNLGKNWEILTNTVAHPKAVTSIDGIRVITIMIIMFGHLLNNTIVLPGVNTTYFYLGTDLLDE